MRPGLVALATAVLVGLAVGTTYYSGVLSQRETSHAGSDASSLTDVYSTSSQASPASSSVTTLSAPGTSLGSTSSVSTRTSIVSSSSSSATTSTTAETNTSTQSISTQTTQSTSTQTTQSIQTQTSTSSESGVAFYIQHASVRFDNATGDSNLTVTVKNTGSVPLKIKDLVPPPSGTSMIGTLFAYFYDSSGNLICSRGTCVGGTPNTTGGGWVVVTYLVSGAYIGESLTIDATYLGLTSTVIVTVT